MCSLGRRAELSPRGTAAPCCPKGECSARLCFPHCTGLDTSEVWKLLWKNICTPGEKKKSQLLCFQKNPECVHQVRTAAGQIMQWHTQPVPQHEVSPLQLSGEAEDRQCPSLSKSSRESQYPEGGSVVRGSRASTCALALLAHVFCIHIGIRSSAAHSCCCRGKKEPLLQL